MSSTVALLTDFGQSDPFVGIMKGVILSRSPQARIVDLSHDIPPQDIRLGAFYLKASVAYFPKGTLFVCVVDPGVGSDRRIIWAKTKTHQFLAPDNGLLSWAQPRESLLEVREVTNQRLFAAQVSRTFHGRDIFAPVAGELAKGLTPSKLGAKLSAIQEMPFPAPKSDEGNLRGTILAIDRFGNAITNLANLEKGAKIWFRERQLGGIKFHYSEVEPGASLALIGSFGFVELAVREGSFKERFNVKVGDPVDVSS